MTGAQAGSVSTYGAPEPTSGVGAAEGTGHDLAVAGDGRVLVVTDAGVAVTGRPRGIAERMPAYGTGSHVSDGTQVGRTDERLLQVVGPARATGPWDAPVAVGDGSCTRSPSPW